MQLIDSHVHFWRIGRNGHAWPGAELAEIHRDFLEGDFAGASAGIEVEAAVLVQSQPNELDTGWLLELAAESGKILGVVGWADLAAADAPERIAALAKHPKLRGLRPMLQAIAEDGWINRPELEPALATMEAHGLVFDALVQPRHLRPLQTLADRHPHLRIVVDHCAKPNIAERGLEPWRSEIGALAQRPNVFCKLSGLSSECAPGQDASAVLPYIQEILSIFPSDRLLWGSDWPVVNTRSDYRGWFDICLKACGPMSLEDKDAVFRRTALDVYGLH